MNVIAMRHQGEAPLPPEDPGSELGTISLKWILSFLLRRWIIIGVTGAIALVVCFASFLFQPPQFTATALVLIQVGPDRTLTPQQQMINGGETPANAGPIMDSQVEILRSRMLVARLVDALRLVNDPEWNGELPRQPQTAAEREEIRENVIDAVAEAIQVRRRGLTFVAEVSATSTNPFTDSARPRRKLSWNTGKASKEQGGRSTSSMRITAAARRSFRRRSSSSWALRASSRAN